MKRTTVLVVLLLALVGAAGVFASGNKEQPAQPGAPGPRGAYGRGAAPEFSEEKITVTGQLYFRNLMHPELKSGGKEYELLVPRFYVYDLDLQEGTTVTVEGYEVTGMPYFEQESEDEVHLWVTKAVVNGQEYDLERYGMGGWMGGPRGGMMGPRGRGSWGRGSYGPSCWGDWGGRRG